jgi:hypothetical protein
MMKGDWKYQAVGPGRYELRDDNGAFGDLKLERGCPNLVGLMCDAMNSLRRSSDPTASKWKPVNTAPLDGEFVVMRGDSGYVGTPYRLKIARYERTRAKEDTPGRPFDEDAWRDHGGDNLKDDGEFPTEWCYFWELGLGGKVRPLRDRVVQKELYGTGGMHVTVVAPAHVGTPLQAIKYALAQIDDERSDVEVEVFLRDWSEGAVGAYSERYQKFIDANPDEPEHVAEDGTVRKSHYGSGRQPWDDAKDDGRAEDFAAVCVLKYLRRTKPDPNDLNDARWYYARLHELTMNSLRAEEDLAWLDRLLTPEEKARLA